MILPGQLNYRIDIQNPTETKDALGVVSTSYASIGSVWARVFEKLNREVTDYNTTQGVQSSTIFEITIRTNDLVTTASKIIYDSRTLGILSIAKLMDRTGMLITAVEVT